MEAVFDDVTTLNVAITFARNTQRRHTDYGNAAEYEEATTVPRMLRTKDYRIERHKITVTGIVRGGQRDEAQNYSGHEIGMMLRTSNVTTMPVSGSFLTTYMNCYAVQHRWGGT